MQVSLWIYNSNDRKEVAEMKPLSIMVKSMDLWQADRQERAEMRPLSTVVKSMGIQ